MEGSFKKLFALVLISALASLPGCFPFSKQEVRAPEKAVKRVRYFLPEFSDDMDRASLILALERNRHYFSRLDPDRVFQYGPHEFTSKQVSESQKHFLDLLSSCPDPDQFNKKVRKDFFIYKSPGGPERGKVLFTGYFEPLYDASLVPDETYKWPIYRKPDDLVSIDLSSFKKRFKGERIIARIDGNRILPYYSRNQIEADGVLKGQGLEIAWLRDPVDVAFLHIQGSGRLQLPEGRFISAGYHASNGLAYRSIGKYMLDHGLLTRDEMSMQSIRRYLSRNPDKVDLILGHNPSYVFFKILEKGPLGNISVPLTPGRSLALDSRLFPKGALTFISCQKPVLGDDGEILSWEKFSRFVLNQDTGGAIKGPGRADIFWGSGHYAEMAAGHMKHDGELYLLIKKP